MTGSTSGSARPRRSSRAPRVSSGRSSSSRTPSAYGQSSSTASCQPRPTLVGREQAVDPHLGVHAVVRLLAVDLRRDARELGVVGSLERARAGSRRPSRRASAARSSVPTRAGVARRAARSGTPPAAVERELVGGGAELGGGELVERPRVADLVLGDRRERDVFLEERRDPGPLRVAPAEDELVVGDREEQVRARRSRVSSPAPCRACPRARAPRAAAP